jgi:hypothetical protein
MVQRQHHFPIVERCESLVDVTDRDKLGLDDVLGERVDYRLGEVLVEREQAAHAIAALCGNP